METRIEELEEIVKDLEKKVWALTELVQMLAEDALAEDYAKGFAGEEKKTLRSLLKKI